MLASQICAGDARAQDDLARYNALVDVFNVDAAVAGWSYDKATDYFSDSDTRTACRFVAIYLVNQQHALAEQAEIARLDASDPARASDDALATRRMQADLDDRTQLYREVCSGINAADAGFDRTMAALQGVGDQLAQQATLTAMVEKKNSFGIPPSCLAARKAVDVYLSALDDITLTRRQSGEAKVPPPTTVSPFETSASSGLANARSLLAACPTPLQR